MMEKTHWPRVTFGQVVALNTDRIADPASANIECYVGLEHIEPDDLRIRRWGSVADGTTFTNLFKPGQVLFGKRRAYQRKVAVADFKGVCSSDIYVFESKDPDLLLPELLPFLCQTDGFFEHAVGTSAGSLSPRTNWTQLAAYEFALPPLEEQRRIAEVLWALESQKEALFRLWAQTRIVKHALEKKIFMLDDAREKAFLGQLIQEKILSLQTGPFGTILKASSYTTDGYPVVNPSDMVDGEVRLEKCRFVNHADWVRLSGYQLHPGDIFIGRKGDMQNIVLMKPEYNSCLMGSDTIRFRVDDSSLEPRFLYYFLRADSTRQWLQSQAYGTIMPGINERLLARITIPVVPLDLQLMYVEQIDMLDNSESTIKRRLRESTSLKVATLKNLQ